MALTKAHNRMIEGSIVNVRDFGAVGDGVTDDTAAILAAAASEKASGKSNAMLFFPASKDPYVVTDLQFTSAHGHVKLIGEGYNATKIKCVKNTANYGIDFALSDNSWGGLDNIRVEAAGAFDATVRVLSSNNAFMIDAWIGGGNAADYCLFIDGGSAFFCPFIYTTGAVNKNFRINADANVCQYLFESGNHDIGPNGFVDWESSFSGSGLVMLRQRMEAVTGKNLVHSNLTASGGMITLTGRTIGGAANSIVRRITGGAPRLQLDLNCDNSPTYWYTDALSATVVEAPNGFTPYFSFPPQYTYSDLVVSMSSAGDGGRLKMSRGTGNVFDFFADTDEVNLRNADTSAYSWVAGDRGLRLGDYRQPDVGKEGLQVSGGFGINIDGGGWNNGHLRLGNYRIWVDSTGDLRIKNGAPTSDTDGTVVGTQS